MPCVLGMLFSVFFRQRSCINALNILRLATIGLQKVSWDLFICSRWALEALGTFSWSIWAAYQSSYSHIIRFHGGTAFLATISCSSGKQRSLKRVPYFSLCNCELFGSHLASSISNFNVSLWISEFEVTNFQRVYWTKILLELSPKLTSHWYFIS